MDAEDGKGRHRLMAVIALHGRAEKRDGCMFLVSIRYQTSKIRQPETRLIILNGAWIVEENVCMFSAFVITASLRRSMTIVMNPSSKKKIGLYVSEINLSPQPI